MEHYSEKQTDPPVSNSQRQEILPYFNYGFLFLDLSTPSFFCAICIKKIAIISLNHLFFSVNIPSRPDQEINCIEGSNYFLLGLSPITILQICTPSSYNPENMGDV